MVFASTCVHQTTRQILNGTSRIASLTSALNLPKLVALSCSWNNSSRNNVSRRNYGDCLKSPPCLRDELICNVVERVQDGSSKVTVIGAGTTGIACVNSILFQKISSHVALVDPFPKKLQGEGLDYSNGLTFLGDPRIEFDTDFCISSNSKVVIVTAGARQSKNESKQQLVQQNAQIIKSIIMPLIEYSPKAVFIIVSNPVDVMTWLAWKVSGLPINRVLGSGTHLDTAIFRSMLAKRLGVASNSVHGFVIGEHGETQVPLWSGVSIAGAQFRDVLPNVGLTTDEEKWYEVTKEVVTADSTVRCLKGYSNTAIGLAVADIAKAILTDSQAVKAVSTLVQGHHGIAQETFLSLPCSIGENGISNVMRLRITEKEKKMLLDSAGQVFNEQKGVKI